MSVFGSEVRQGVYFDSVVLMQLQKALVELDRVDDAGVVMATDANRELLAASGFDVRAIAASPDDLLIVVRAADQAAVDSALAQVDDLLKRRQAQVANSYRPRSLLSATSALPDARWVLISVPGRYAAGVAEEALKRGKHVFLYSDNVSAADELRLKQQARDAGRLLMGPDCGTAIINGAGLGFANRVRRGHIGVVAASGTGLQAVATDIHNLGGGVSQAIGTGGRDLKAEIGGLTALQALDLLARDPNTRVIVLVSKPPHPAVAARLLRRAAACGKPVVVNFIGYPPPARTLGSLHFAVSLSDAASLAVELAGTDQTATPAAETPIDGYVRGLFSGGTLAYEMLLGLQTVLHPLYSNIPIHSDQRLADSLQSEAHTILDLGEDEFTQGRLHPMMDNDLRLRRLRHEAADPETGLLLLDVVLGEGAHPDPASELAPAIAAVSGQRPDLPVLAIVLGTPDDPQDIDRQRTLLREAGAMVVASPAEALAWIAARLPAPAEDDTPPLPLDDFAGDLTAINVGLESFADSLNAQGARAVQVEWRPPAGGNEKMMSVLARLKAASSKH